MAEKIKEPVSVNLAYNHKKRQTKILKIIWKNAVYNINKHGLHYTFKKGSTLIHVFSVSNSSLNFKLTFDTDSLNWMLEEVYDPVSR